MIAYPYGNQSGQSGNTLSSPEKGFPDYPLVRKVENTSPEPFLHLLFVSLHVGSAASSPELALDQSG